jgi:hypothetical protein
MILGSRFTVIRDLYAPKGYASMMHNRENVRCALEQCQECEGSPIKPPRSEHCEECCKDVLMME